jgi:hypothetical protein
VFAAARRSDEDDIEHAMGESRTLCGLSRSDVVVYRHHFGWMGDRACPTCRDEAAKAPTTPSAQERLYTILDSAEGPLRGELREALRTGAKIPFWVNGWGRSMIEHYAKNPIVENGEAVAVLAEFEGRLSLARVTAGRHFLVLMPENAPPVIAVEAPDR